MNAEYASKKVGAWSYNIEVLCRGNTGETVTVEAFIVGQLGIHEAINDPWYHAVTHVKSGCIVALFSSGMIATDWAAKVQRIIDFDAYADMIIKDGKKLAEKTYAPQLEKIRNLRTEYSGQIPMKYYPTVSRKILSKVVSV